MTGLSLWLRSLCFNVGWYAGTVVIALVGSPILVLPRRAVLAWATFWIDFVLWWLRLTCRLTYRVVGLENLPKGPVIIACKHQRLPGRLVLAGDIAVARGDGA